MGNIIPRSKEVYALRGVGMILILLFHIFIIPVDCFKVTRSALTVVLRGSWVGVDLFLVLSGFLVSALAYNEYESTGNINCGAFIGRRLLRIIPPFYVYLAGYLVVMIMVGKPWSFAQLLSELLFLQNYFGGFVSHTWILGLEVHFYLLISVCLLALHSRFKNLNWMPCLCLLIIVASAALRTTVYFGVSPYSSNTHYYPTHLRLDSLFVGVLASWVYHYRRSWLDVQMKTKRYLLVAFVILGICPCFIEDMSENAYIHTAGMTLASVGWVCALLLVMYKRSESGECGRLIVTALSFIGLHSYSIYLWHLTIRFWAPATLRAFGMSDTWNVAMVCGYLFGSVVLGVIMSWAVERPANVLRNRLIKVKA